MDGSKKRKIVRFHCSMDSTSAVVKTAATQIPNATAAQHNGVYEISVADTPVAVMPIVGTVCQLEPVTPEQLSCLLTKRPNGKSLMFIYGNRTWINQHLDSSTLVQQPDSWQDFHTRLATRGYDQNSYRLTLISRFKT